MDSGNMIVEDDKHTGFRKAVEDLKDNGPIRKTFAYHKPSEGGLTKITLLRRAFSEITDLVEQNAPNTRERAVAITNIEQAAMWAIKAVVCSDPESVVAE